MSEPTTVKYPTGYDDDTTLFGPLQERNIATVKYSIAVNELQVCLEEALSTLVGPLFALFEGGEIWYVEATGVNVVNGDTYLTLSDISQRGFHGSPIQPHNNGELVYFSLHAGHVNQLRKAIKAMQKYGFLLGTSAQRVAHVPVAGEAWLETDGSKGIYYCFIADNWTRVDYTNHGSLTDLANDSHTQYHTDARATTWHTAQPGYHILGGDNHNHYSSNQGSSVMRIVSGLDANKGTPTVTGQLYFATDTAEGGTLYVSADGATWSKVSGVPSGAIAPFSGACPGGWTRFTALDGKYLRASTGGVSSGGVASHTHEIHINQAHYHTLDAVAASATAAADHNHSFSVMAGAGGSGNLTTTSIGGGVRVTTDAGGHGHSATVAQATSASAGSSYPSTAAANNDPSYAEVVFCKKD